MNQQIINQINKLLQHFLKLSYLKLENYMFFDMIWILSSGKNKYCTKLVNKKTTCCLKTCNNSADKCINGSFLVCDAHVDAVHLFLQKYKYSHENTLDNIQKRILYLLVFKDRTGKDHIEAIFRRIKSFRYGLSEFEVCGDWNQWRNLNNFMNGKFRNFIIETINKVQIK